MRRVQVESPFAPRTPLPVGKCISVLTCGRHGSTCEFCTALFAAHGLRELERQRHARYLALCLRDCLDRGETPYASHAILTLPGVLRDDVPEERERGIAAGFAMRRGMHATVIYVDCYSDEWRSGGMQRGRDDAGQLIYNEPQLMHDFDVRRLRESNPLWVPVEYKAP